MPFLNSQLSIAIVGGGIGGWVLALQLEADRFKNIEIFEASRELKAIGSGINLQPSAVVILRNLGLFPALEATGIKTAELRYYNRYGHYVTSEPRGEAAGYLVPQFSIHRGMLHTCC
jgi:2-polyprenyl-6-methoxyphenol hydroxylase-like FAD-dependent oxidoreductase